MPYSAPTASSNALEVFGSPRPSRARYWSSGTSTTAKSAADAEYRSRCAFLTSYLSITAA
jgi:hypothetical protein